MVLQIFGIVRWLARPVEIRVRGDRLVTLNCGCWHQAAILIDLSWGVGSEHLRQMILGSLVVCLSPQGLFLRRLDIVDQIFFTTTPCVVIVRHPVVFIVQRKAHRGVHELALELGLLGIDDHFFSVLVGLELFGLPCVVR